MGIREEWLEIREEWRRIGWRLRRIGWRAVKLASVKEVGKGGTVDTNV